MDVKLLAIASSFDFARAMVGMFQDFHHNTASPEATISRPG